MNRQDFEIRNCGCGGRNVWRVHLVEYYKDGRGRERKRDVRALTGKMAKPEVDAKLAEYKSGRISV